MTDILDLRPWTRPEITGIGRLPMRPRLVPYPGVAEALATDTLDRGETVDLNGTWDFRYFASPEEATAWLRAYQSDAAGTVDRDGWADIAVPANWTLEGWDKPHYTNVQMPFPESPPEPPAANPTGIYRRRFRWDTGDATTRASGPAGGPGGAGTSDAPGQSTAPGEPGERFVLHLGGAESVAIIWLDGEFVGLAKDTRLESEFDITAMLGGPQRDHELLIMVVRYSDASFIEDQDQWWMAGLYRDVYIYREPAVHLKQLRLRPVLEGDNAHGHLVAEVELGGVEIAPGAAASSATSSAASGPWTVEVAIFDGPGDLLNDSTRPHPDSRAAAAAAAAGAVPRRAPAAYGTLPRGAAPPVPLAGTSGICTGAPATDGHVHESPDRADRLRLESATIPVQPWSAESPYLYTVTITIRAGAGADAGAGPGSAGGATDSTATAPAADRILAVYRRHIGFRRVEIADRQLLINGRAVMIHGVNRHEHDPDTGKRINTESMIRDLELLKQFNFNAVRTAHYPNHPSWYDLCDRYGIYLWDEANIESHHYYNDICRDSRYTAAFVDRVQRMVQRDYDHPAVIVWSLGNESGYGPNHDAAAGWVRHADPTRPLHYEGAVRTEWGQNSYDFRRGRTATDIIAPMYAPVSEITGWSRSEGIYATNAATTGGAETDSAATPDPRPLILCEYSHAMGNSNGGLADYYAAFRAEHGLQGGFIWDWVDQGLRARTPDGTEYWAYGGDFDDEPTDRDFCINGLIWPDRTPHPAIWEFKKLAQQWEIELTFLRSPPGPTVQLALRTAVDQPGTYTLRWELADNGTVTATGTEALPPVAADSAVTLTPQIPVAALADGSGAGDASGGPGSAVERVLTATVIRTDATALTPAEHPVAWEQWVVSSPGGAGSVPVVPAAGARAWPGPALAAAEAASGAVLQLSSTGTGPVLAVGKAAGDTVIAGPELSLWRAPTENDLIRSMPGQEGKPGSRWIGWGLNALRAEWEYDAGSGEVRGVYSAAGTQAAGPGRMERARVTLRLAPVSDDPTAGSPAPGSSTAAQFHGGAWYLLHARAEIDAEITDLPRIGLRFTLPPGWEDVEWYGRGPAESYPDRATGYPLGLWRSTVTAEYVPYIVPQEHGGHTDTRFVRLSRSAPGGGTLEIAAPAGETFHFSALHTAPEDLDTCAHTADIVPRPETVLMVDHFHRGIGTAACGPDCDIRWTRGGGVVEWRWYVRWRE